MKLSILILTMPQRKESLERLIAVLRPQLTVDVEILLRDSPPLSLGGPTRGQKRNEALGMANGRWVAFVDDDDLVSEDYVSQILTALEQNPDVVGLKGHYIVGNNPPELFAHSMQYSEWVTKDGVHQRCPNHLNPVRHSLALEAGFGEKDYGEDQDYSMRLLPLLNSEVMIDKVIYYYLK